MGKQIVLTHEFVEFIPDDLKEGTIYISIKFATAVHRCCCGCGKEVVTPLSPTDWKLIFDGKTISLDPSIGNWAFECLSHYWIRNNRFDWLLGGPQKRLRPGEFMTGLLRIDISVSLKRQRKVGQRIPAARWNRVFCRR